MCVTKTIRNYDETMANDEVLGPRKTMFVLVIVVGCFAVLWPRILSPLLLGHTREQLKPNQFDRDAGCCEVIFETEVAVLELVNEVCNSAVGVDGKLSSIAAAECRRSVNETCGLDIAAFLKRNENVGKTTKMLLETMKTSNSSCLKEHFGVPVWSLSTHQALNSWVQQDTLKQERPPVRGAGPHPALRERGRAIPPGAPTPPSRGPVPLPPHARVRNSPLSVYFDLEIKPPPIPGMRPPLGSPGGPVPAPKSSMGFVMPIYTICIIVFFVYTLSKILFKRTGSTPYEQISPDPQFRRRVFRDDSRSSPETKLVVTAISGLVAEVQQQMEASYAQNQQRQDVQDNHTRPYTNGTVLSNSTPAPVHIVTSEYREPSKEKSPEPQKGESSPQSNETPQKEVADVESIHDNNESSPGQNEFNLETKDISEPKESIPEPKELTPEPIELTPEPKELTPEPKELTPETTEPTPESTLEPKESTPEPKDLILDHNEITLQAKVSTLDVKEPVKETEELQVENEEISTESKDEISEHNNIEANHKDANADLVNLTESVKVEKEKDSLAKLTEDFLNDAREELRIVTTPDLEESTAQGKQSTQELLEEALKEESPTKNTENEEAVEDEEHENASVKHEAEEVKSIFLETEIPQQSRVLVTDFAEDRADEPPPTRHSPLVVSGKMTLSLIQDAPRETPDRDLESTVDEFTTASAFTLPAAEKQEELSEEEVEEEIEVEEIEEEVEEEEEEEQEHKELKKTGETKTE